MKKLSGFSLMEMMVVLLIISIVAAASVPMVNKKMLGAASDKSPWVWTGMTKNIAYNLNDADITASIGIVNPPATAKNPKLYVDTKKGTDGYYKSQIAFGHDGGQNVLKLVSANNNVWLSSKNTNFDNTANTVVIGPETESSNYRAVAIGYNSYAEDVGSVVIGNNTRLKNVGSEESVAIGSQVNITGAYGVAIGSEAKAGKTSLSFGWKSNTTGRDSIAIGSTANTGSATNAIAIGNSSNANMPRSIAIGYDAVSNRSDAIAIGGKFGANGTRATGVGAIAIGTSAQASQENSLAIGSDAQAPSARAIALGNVAQATSVSAIALGYDARASYNRAVAIGEKARATSSNAIALGYNAQALHSNSVAIGRNARTTQDNQIMLGTSSDKVEFGGQLIVDSLIVRKYADIGGYLPYGRSALKVRVGSRHPETNAWLNYGHANNDSRYEWMYPCKYDNSWLNVSDRRLKNIGDSFKGGLAEIKKLNVFNFTFKDDKSKTPHVGVMAQDLQKIFPDAVIKGEDGFLRIRMEDMFYALVNAVKELSVKFESHDKKIEELTKQNLELQKTIINLEKRIEKLEQNK